MAEISGVKFITVIWSPYADHSTGTPADVNANTEFALPSGFPEIESIIGGCQLASSSGTQTSITLTGAIPATSLATGGVSKVDGNSIKMGTANQIKDLVSLTYRYV